MGAKRYGYFRSGEVFCMGRRQYIPAEDLARPELFCHPFVYVSIVPLPAQLSLYPSASRSSG